MTHALLPPPITPHVLLTADSRDQTRAMLQGYGCARCKVGLREPGSDECVRCLSRDDDELIRSAAECRREIRERVARMEEVSRWG